MDNDTQEQIAGYKREIAAIKRMAQHLPGDQRHMVDRIWELRRKISFLEARSA